MSQAAKPFIKLHNGRPSHDFAGNPFPVANDTNGAKINENNVLNLTDVAEQVEKTSTKMRGLARLISDMIETSRKEHAPTSDEQFGIYMLMVDQADAMEHQSSRLRLSRSDALWAIAEIGR